MSGDELFGPCGLSVQENFETLTTSLVGSALPADLRGADRIEVLRIRVVAGREVRQPNAQRQHGERNICR